MVTYNPKDWFRLFVHMHKSDTMRILFPAMLLLGAVTGVVCYLERRYFLGFVPQNLVIFHQISGFIISLVLVFRINSAYDRWWEGRKLWGALLNSSRNLSVKLSNIIPPDDRLSRETVRDLISSFAVCLKEHLRDNSAVAKVDFTRSMTREQYREADHRPSYIMQHLSSESTRLCSQVSGTHAEFFVISSNLNEMIDICGGCERIRNTPIPYAYSIFIKKIVLLYIITLPLSLGMSLGYWSIPVTMTIFYAFASLELISEEIEDPFGRDENDLPTDEIAEKIKLNSTQILCS